MQQRRQDGTGGSHELALSEQATSQYEYPPYARYAYQPRLANRDFYQVRGKRTRRVVNSRDAYVLRAHRGSRGPSWKGDVSYCPFRRGHSQCYVSQRQLPFRKALDLHRGNTSTPLHALHYGSLRQPFRYRTAT